MPASRRRVNGRHNSSTVQKNDNQASSLPMVMKTNNTSAGKRRRQRSRSTLQGFLLRFRNNKRIIFVFLPSLFLCLGILYMIEPFWYDEMFQYPKELTSRLKQHYKNEKKTLSSTNDEKISVIVMNYARPRNLQPWSANSSNDLSLSKNSNSIFLPSHSLMETLINHPNIDEILLLHANPKTYFTYEHPKVRNIDATIENRDMGLSIRFHFCSQANSNYILHVDDDMLFSAVTLDLLKEEFFQNTKRIVGVWGRRLNWYRSGWFTNSYSTMKFPRQVDVVLTKLMMMEKKACEQFHQYSEPLVGEYVKQNSKPLWNGEDIFMSLITTYYYTHVLSSSSSSSSSSRVNARIHYAMPWLSVYEAPDVVDEDGKNVAIGANFHGFNPISILWWEALISTLEHFSYRGKLWKYIENQIEKKLILKKET